MSLTCVLLGGVLLYMLFLSVCILMRCKRMPFTVQSAPVRRVNTLCLHGERVPLFFPDAPARLCRLPQARRCVPTSPVGCVPCGVIGACCVAFVGTHLGASAFRFCCPAVPTFFPLPSAFLRKGIPPPSPCGEGRGGGYTLKYLSGVLANISPQMLSPGFIMQVSVRVRPVSSPTPSRRNTCRFSVWSGQAP